MAKTIIPKTIGILGPGAIGGLLAQRLAACGHRMVLLGRGERLTEPVDLLFITVKSPHLVEALAQVPREHVVGAVTVPLLNGAGHAAAVRAALGTPVAAGTIGSVEAVVEDGVAKQLSVNPPHIDLASREVSREMLNTIAEILRDAGLSVSVLDSEEEVVWKKLVRLNAIATATAAAGQPLGMVRTDPVWRPVLEALVQESSAVAAAEGVAVPPAQVLADIDKLPASLMTSLQRDIAAGKPSELDAIPGGVLALAARYGVACPVLAAQYAALIKHTKSPIV